MRRTPFHRRFATAFAALPRRARVAITCSLVLLLWRIFSSLFSTVASVQPRERDRRTPGATPSSKGVAFAPTQVRRTAARVRFSKGTVQEVFVAPPRSLRAVVREEPPLDELWSEGEVASVEVPVGMTLSYEREGGEPGKIELRAGDTCEGGACVGIRRVKLEQDVLVGLRQMRESGALSSLSSGF